MKQAEKHHLAGTAYVKYALGDPLSDEEVKAGAEVGMELAAALKHFGGDFVLAKRALAIFAGDMECYHAERARQRQLGS